MQIESVRDILTWTKNFHTELAKCLEHCESEHGERTKMAMRYLSLHEHHLANLVSALTQKADLSELETFVIEYLEKQPISLHQVCRNDFVDLSESEIVAHVFHQHKSVTDLYQYFKERASIPHQQELLDHLLNLERQELVIMAQGINRFQDM